MAVPKYDELMKPLLIAVSYGETYKMKDVTALLAEQLNLSSDDLAEMLPSGRQTVFKNRVGWAKTYLKKPDFSIARPVPQLLLRMLENKSLRIIRRK